MTVASKITHQPLSQTCSHCLEPRKGKENHLANSVHISTRRQTGPGLAKVQVTALLFKESHPGGLLQIYLLINIYQKHITKILCLFVRHIYTGWLIFLDNISLIIYQKNILKKLVIQMNFQGFHFHIALKVVNHILAMYLRHQI